MQSVLAQAQASQVIVKAASPWITLGAAALAAVIAGLIACVGWYVVHRTSRSRDLLNWRRTALLQAATSLIDASNHRNEILHTKDALRSELRTQYYRMQVPYDQIRICGSEDVFSLATRVMKLHHESEEQITAYPTRWLTEEPMSRHTKVGDAQEYAGLDSKQLYAYHHSLISEVQVDLKLVSRKDALKFPWPEDAKKDKNRKAVVQ
ncbi:MULTISPECIES: hypothetical protein [Rhodococcus]|uniref:hypothetical protein n=1 Tax=Rhodococcus TaxID=1827 RepID=UPI000AFA9E87|nr:MULTISPECIES: hypothetical protein [Rhodococcus]MCE4165232.1 hypothetical protein [Rhodococcus sp. Ni2]